MLLTEIDVTSQQSRCKSIHVAPNEKPTRTHTRTEFPVSGLSQSPNHSVTPPLLGSSFCLCFSSSMNFSCISSMEPSSGVLSFSGKMSGKVNVWFWAWDAEAGGKKSKMSKETTMILPKIRILTFFFYYYYPLKID